MKEEIIRQLRSCFLIKEERLPVIEVILPISTINNDLISVFIQEYEGQFVVDDAGWLLDGEYGEIHKNTNVERIRKLYGIDRRNFTTDSFEITVENEIDIPGAILDLATFIFAVLTDSTIKFDEENNPDCE